MGRDPLTMVFTAFAFGATVGFVAGLALGILRISQ